MGMATLKTGQSEGSAARSRPLWPWAASLAIFLLLVFAGTSAVRAAGKVDVEAQKWSFNGVFGTYDKGQLQRGYKVYQEVCASCHGLKLVYYRNLGEPGGPGFSAAEVKALAAAVQVVDGPNEDGEMFERPGRPSDAFVSPFENDNAARAANNGALPPDLSVIAKARDGGPDFLYALLTGYVDPPAGLELQEGMTYNTVFPGHQIAMPSPIVDGQVEYDDGTPATAENIARDVTAFLMWAAEPKLEERKRIGFQVIIFLLVLAGLMYMVVRRVWDGVPH